MFKSFELKFSTFELVFITFEHKFRSIEHNIFIGVKTTEPGYGSNSYWD